MKSMMIYASHHNLKIGYITLIFLRLNPCINCLIKTLILKGLKLINYSERIYSLPKTIIILTLKIKHQKMNKKTIRMQI